MSIFSYYRRPRRFRFFGSAPLRLDALVIGSARDRLHWPIDSIAGGQLRLALVLLKRADTLLPSALTAMTPMTAMKTSNRPYSTMLAPRSSELNLATSQVFRMNRSTDQLQS